MSLRRLVFVGHTPVIHIAPEGLSKFIQTRQQQYDQQQQQQQTQQSQQSQQSQHDQSQQQSHQQQSQQPTTTSPTAPALTIVAVHFSAWTYQYAKANNDPRMWAIINHHFLIPNPGAKTSPQYAV